MIFTAVDRVDEESEGATTDDSELRCVPCEIAIPVPQEPGEGGAESEELAGSGGEEPYSEA